LEANFKFLTKQNLTNLKHQNDVILNELFSSLSSTTSQSINVNLNQIRNQFTIIPLTTTALITISNHLNSYNIQTLGSTSAGGGGGGQTTNMANLNYDKLASEIENQLIIYFKRYLDYLIEIFLLLKILNEHKYHFISKKLDVTIKNDLLKYYYKDYLSSTYQLYEVLITALIHSYIDDNVSTDNLNKNLKNYCPSLFTNENAIYTKACEKIKQAMNISNNEYERKNLLTEAIGLIKQISYINNLDDICKTLFSVRCYDAIFDLCLNAASKRDPQNISLYYYKKGESIEDLQGAFYYSQRSDCYKYMFHCLTLLNRSTKSSSLIQSQPQQQQQQQVFDESTQLNQQPISVEQANEFLNELIDRIIKSGDELANVFLFNWMIDSNMKNELFKIKSPFLESYLQIKASSKVNLQKKKKQPNSLSFLILNRNVPI
jgi:nuclear pore complex protein Nup155